MLYDKRWDKPEVKADPFSLESLIAWLEKQPADQTYDYADSERCMMGQWLRSIDPQMELGLGCSYTYVVHGEEHDFRDRFQPIASRGEDRNGFTFGAALERARAAAQK